MTTNTDQASTVTEGESASTANEDLVAGTLAPPPPTAQEQEQIDRLSGDFDDAHLMPLWTQRGDLMPESPAPRRTFR